MIPLMTKSAFQKQSGIGRDKLNELIRLKILPSIELGDRSVAINVALLNEQLITGTFDTSALNPEPLLKAIK